MADSDRHRIVVGTDGSPSSADALRWAAKIAVDTGAEVDVITCWQYPQGWGMPGVSSDWNPANDAAQVLADSLAEAFGDKHPDGLRACVREGHAAQVLVQASAGADMLVVGSRGHGGFVGLLLGSVSAHCAEHGQCPVVVVPHAPRSAEHTDDESSVPKNRTAEQVGDYELVIHLRAPDPPTRIALRDLSVQLAEADRTSLKHQIEAAGLAEAPVMSIQTPSGHPSTPLALDPHMVTEIDLVELRREPEATAMTAPIFDRTPTSQSQRSAK
ncbi:MAG: universal stress protein [Jatrophihabitans sp.]